MNLLIIGGSYFLGLAFAEAAYHAGHSLYVLNRGNRPLGVSSIPEYHADRRDATALEAFPAGAEGKPLHFDAVVDFCAYQSGDIRLMAEHLNASFDQYIFISTSDVYRKGSGQVLREDAELESRDFGGDAGAYILGKVALERELAELTSASDCNFHSTIFRPAFLYGQGNYAPREVLYFQWIHQSRQVLHPRDGEGFFQMVSAEDAARAILLSCGNEVCYGKAYNLAAPTLYTYESYEELLRKATGVDFGLAPVTVAQALQDGLPLPFPLSKAESEHYDGSAVTALGLTYSDPVPEFTKLWELYQKQVAARGGNPVEG